MKRTPKHTIKYLTQDELRQLLKTITNPRDKAIILLAYRHGLRASEIGELQISDIDFHRSRIRITRKKGSLPGEHLMKPDELTLLKRYLKTRKDQIPTLFLSRQNTPIHRATLDYLMKRYGHKANLPINKRHFHTLKHSIAVHMLDAGADLLAVKDWLGHAHIGSTMTYAHLTSQTRDAMHRRIFASGKIV
jgi:integrase